MASGVPVLAGCLGGGGSSGEGGTQPLKMGMAAKRNNRFTPPGLGHKLAATKEPRALRSAWDLRIALRVKPVRWDRQFNVTQPPRQTAACFSHRFADIVNA